MDMSFTIWPRKGGSRAFDLISWTVCLCDIIVMFANAFGMYFSAKSASFQASVLPEVS